MAMNPAATFPPAASLDLPHGDDTSKTATVILLVLVAAILGEVVAFMTWGPVALTMSALVLVPLMFIFFVSISWPGKSRRQG